MTAQELATQNAPQALADSTPGEIMMNAPLLAQIDHLANRMAEARATIPKHLAGNPGDCWAVIMQAVQWRMNPFVVAQKTHLVNGTLGYEAQLVNAVVKASGAIEGAFKYEYRGEGNDLECRVGAVLKGETEITWGQWLKISSVTTKNSPLWKTNPPQQLGYLQVKNFARAYCPEALLGVYTPDELQEIPAEREVGPRASSLNDQLLRPAPAAAHDQAPAEEPSADPTVPPAPKGAEEPASESLTYAEVADMVNRAGTQQELSDLASTTLATFLGQGDNEKFRDELTGLYKARREAIARAQEISF
jgi:hypothetical protein